MIEMTKEEIEQVAGGQVALDKDGPYVVYDTQL